MNGSWVGRGPRLTRPFEPATALAVELLGDVERWKYGAVRVN